VSDVSAALERIVGRDAVASFAPGALHDIAVARPKSEAELVELLRFAARESKRVLPIGCGTMIARERGGIARERGDLARERTADRVDFAISTRGLNGVVAYEPGDGTLTALAGSTMHDVAEAARAGGNHVTPDVAHPTHATLGGVLAAGRSGVDRTRFGPARHHVLGMRVALADGTLARSGGRLVKNVTGYDMHRLYCGSRGSLCVIVEASLRLFPRPEEEIALVAELDSRARALDCARSIDASGIRAYGIVAENTSARWRLHVLLAGRRETVEWEAQITSKLVPNASVERGERARARFEATRDLDVTRGGERALHMDVQPSQLAATLARFDEAVPCVVHPSIATVDIAAAALEDARPIAGLDWMQRLKRALDPHGVFVSHPALAGL
jgi:glycolate oxidase FAD binding subunit